MTLQRKISFAFQTTVILLFLLNHYLCAQNAQSEIPQSFVEVKKVIPSIVLDLRYASHHNFVGEPINGYHSAKCYLTRQAATALKKVQEDLQKFSLSVKIYDAYRPQRAVNHFIKWAKVLTDTSMKHEFYPAVHKKNLFKEGYIAAKSGHSRGSTVDLTIVPLPLPEQERYTPGQKLCPCTQTANRRFKDNSLDMGTGYDCFSVLSWTGNKSLTVQQRANRLLLKTVMEKHGFKNYSREWWHFTLQNEPFPDTYFDFIIE